MWWYEEDQHRRCFLPTGAIILANGRCLIYPWMPLTNKDLALYPQTWPNFHGWYQYLNGKSKRWNNAYHANQSNPFLVHVIAMWFGYTSYSCNIFSPWLGQRISSFPLGYLTYPSGLVGTAMVCSYLRWSRPLTLAKVSQDRTTITMWDLD